MDAFEIFISACSDPYWIALALFITGFAFGFLVSTFFTLGDYIVQIIVPYVRDRYKKDGKRE